MMSLGNLIVAEPVNLNGPYPAVLRTLGVGDFYLCQVFVPSGQAVNARAFSNSVNASPDASPSIVIGGKLDVLNPTSAPTLPGVGVDTVVAKVNGVYLGPSMVTVRIYISTGGPVRYVDVPFSFQVL
jgi:hypothetical protein